MTDHAGWMPSISIENLRQRAAILATIRRFFAEREVLEVDTPMMSHATVTDIHLQTFKTEFIGPAYTQGKTIYLMTSPEFHMKRLLAAGAGSIYQLCKSFRNEESGRYHNPEFTMLEWYRVGFDHHMLMDEMDALLQLILCCDAAERCTYQQVFVQSVGICPLHATMSELKQAANSHGLADVAAEETDRDTILQLLFSMVVEPHIGQDKPIFVYDFPASQAALAKINATDPLVADRFEVYFRGIELANGFHELDDPQEQSVRFDTDNKKREELGLEVQPVDQHLIESLKAGLPHCSGVALGVDRLMMLAMNQRHLQDVLTFSFDRA